MLMIPKLLILGNGFDKHCGLNSDYYEFFRKEILDTIGERFDLIQLNRDIKNAGFWEHLLIEYYKAKKVIDNKWCAIETIIKDTIWLICFGKKSEDNLNIDSGIWNTAFENTINGYQYYYTDPIENFLFKYCFNFFDYLTPQQRNLPEKELLQLLIKHLLQELYNFERRFCKYLKNNIEELKNTYTVNAVNLLAKLTGFSTKNFQNIESFIHQEIKECEEIINPYQKLIKSKNVNILSKEFSKLKYINILSFNYTNLFDILDVPYPCAYNNVHGKLCNKECSDNCNFSGVIFGIDNSIIQSQNGNAELRIFSKTYRKMLDTNSSTSILPLNNGVPLEIIFYGHSLSEADYSYFQSIFDYYNIYGNDKVSLKFYYSEGFEQTDEIYRLINSYGKSLLNKEQGKNLIHKLLLENRLKIRKIS